MKSRNNISLSIFLSLFVSVFLVLPMIYSCGKSKTVSPSALNIQYQILNLSPGLGSVDLFINFQKVNSASYFYPSSSGYFYLSSIDTPFQIRSGTLANGTSQGATTNLFNFDYILKPNLKYTLFITGMAKSDSAVSLFVTDTASVPALGRGKIRFINLSPRSQGLDVVVNGFPPSELTNVKYLGVSKFIEVPPGNYDLQIFPHGSNVVLQDLQNETLQDGRLYTLYCYGLAGHTDSLAFGAGIITNK